MKGRITTEVQDFDKQITNLKKLLETEIPLGDLEPLLKVMAAIEEIKNERDVYDLKLAVLTETGMCIWVLLTKKTAVWLKNNGDATAARHETRLVGTAKVCLYAIEANRLRCGNKPRKMSLRLRRL